MRRATVATCLCPLYEPSRVFLWDYGIKKKLSARRAKATGREFARALTVRPRTGAIHKDSNHRPDLFVELPTPGGGHSTFGYCHIVAFALLEASHDINGVSCAPHYARPQDQEQYEAHHHVVGDQCDCRIENLSVEHIDRHRSDSREEWQKNHSV